MQIRVPSLLWTAMLASTSAHADGKDPVPGPLPQAHAHNDYHHERPLIDALQNGFCSVEVDVFIEQGELLVGHDRTELRAVRTLQSLYLEPLRDRVRTNEGRVYPGGPTLTLLIDIKSDGRETYAALRGALAEYKDILSSVENGRFHQRAVQVVISGNRPKAEIADDDIRYAGIDGRLSDLNSTTPAHLMPLISDRWSSHFRWRGIGEFPRDEREKLQAVVRKAHAAGRRVRFWSTPENVDVWAELLAAGVDHINTDQLERLRDFLLEQNASPPSAPCGMGGS